MEGTSYTCAHVSSNKATPPSTVEVPTLIGPVNVIFLRS